MPRTGNSGIQLEYETVGDPDDPAIVLTVGLGAQLLECSERFCRPLADAGYFVVRYDNRDAGLSSKATEPYTLADMAADTVGLLDWLEIDRAHLVGASMGGMISQEIAIRYPSRVRSLCSMISTTGARDVGRASKKALATLRQVAAERREDFVERGIRTWQVVGTPDAPGEEEYVRALLAASYDRAYCPEGRARQAAAMAAGGDRTEGLRGVRVPTLVIHGGNDQLIDPSGGKATAAAVPGAEWLLIPGMGHDLPRSVWPTVLPAILRNAA